MQTTTNLLLLAAALFVTANCLTAEGGAKVSQDEVDELVGAYKEQKDFEKIKSAILALAEKKGAAVPSEEKLSEIKKILDKAVAPRVGLIQQLATGQEISNLFDIKIFG